MPMQYAGLPGPRWGGSGPADSAPHAGRRERCARAGACGREDRRAVFERLCRREMSVTELKAGFPISQPAISQHLTVLRHAGLLTERRAGNRRLYRARPEALGEVRAFVEEFWSDHLIRLKAAAEHESRRQ